ncbi:solute carrier family 22 member 6-A-like [Callorhinchus milii]|uniref:solute carrier family 22 member 6-A-like n=1 Tax=Callorhinchus milii TaxID=7868 RepID=UPI001C3F8D29|nr:solute carrier family 22 member 6-A-like [Callorhinchus milii]
MGFSEVLEQVGGMGRFQVVQLALLAIPICLMASHNLLQNFVAAVPDHRCRSRADALGNTSRQSPGNVTGKVPAEELLLPVFIPLDREGRPERCRLFAEPQWQFLDSNRTHEDGSSTTRPCTDGWLYSHGDVTSTIISEWDLVCSHKALKPLAQSVYMAGVLVGALVLGSLSDRLGRRAVLLGSCLLMAVAGSCAALSSSFSLYCLWRFLTGAAQSGIVLNAFSWTVEWLPTDMRSSVVIVNGYSYAAGQLLLAGLAFTIRHWRWLQFTISAPYFICFLYSWWFPESARWLIMNDKADVAVNQLKRVARLNGREAEGSKLTAATLRAGLGKEVLVTGGSHSLIDLFRTPLMRRNIFCTMCVWFACNFGYYGLVMELQGFGVNMYLLQVIFGAVDFPAKTLAALGITYLGRRWTQASTLTLAGAVILINVCIPTELQLVRTGLAVFGKGCLSACFSCVMLYSGELYPTVLRQTAFGLMATMARVGGLVAPLARLTGERYPLVPGLLYGAVPVLAGILATLLPETRGLALPDTIPDIESRTVTGLVGSEEQKKQEILLPETHISLLKHTV